jgi:hypothetical protein
MAKHRAMSAQGVKARTLVGGVMAGGAMALAVPMGMAHAAPTTDTPGPTHTGDKSADAVQRPAFDNPAPVVRVAQAIGDNIYNDKTPLNAALNASPLGTGYHIRMGTPSTGQLIDNPDFPDDPTAPEQILDPGSNGSNGGQLNLAYAAIPYGALGGPKEEDLPGTLPAAFAPSYPVTAPETQNLKRSSVQTNCLSKRVCV